MVIPTDPPLAPKEAGVTAMEVACAARSTPSLPGGSLLTPQCPLADRTLAALSAGGEGVGLLGGCVASTKP